ncbi:hypothetical protein G3A49_04425 [Haloferax volcanii]|jgi:hypothetical protein|uniref:Transmembrane protein n=6 Tax=Haloferax TaxID=2251 RepID=A0A384KDC5_HALVD|nr:MULTISPECIES: hypothetical protein [Haloferax]ADE02618.1 uncharacterized protein HVO_0883 [Haloferax volcanii DS2]ELK54394.1 hypothetical protein D320_10224 [Haloferax sp. BAB-2207]ELY26948.1 hypothetical protein C498_14323 [Haloferax volcanii DS2]ELZ58943.1 hypothetical protein C460_08270 [Haloferax sp. ATCC BAA-646]ELZ64779.1 hypothetical protein C459_09645 [Haloferax sp. ATCC BAA-645]
MEFDLPKTVALLVALVVVGTAALVGMGAMATSTVLMMVTPSMLVFGALCLAIGVKHGEYRASN